MTNLSEQLQQVKDLRTKKEAALAAVATQQDVVNKGEAYQELLRLKVTRDQITEATEAAEKALREAAVARYAETKDKAILPGLTIKIFKKLVYDVKEAEEWARVKAPAVFKFSAAAFEKVAVTLSAPVTVVEDPRAEIASTLE